MIVHNETSTGITSDLYGVRKVLDSTNHPALLLVDIVSSLGTTDYRHDEWGVDVAICGSQKGLMLPPGLGFNAISEKAMITSRNSQFKKYYWSWEQILELNKKGFYPYTPASGLLVGLDESLDMLQEEGLESIFKRHDDYSNATRIALNHWGLENYCKDADQYSQSVTAILIPDGHDADQLRATILEKFDMSLGTGLGKLKGKVFRIGHLGDLNELTLLGTLAGVEMGLELCGVPHNKGGVQQAMNFFTSL
jgi:alanine-glyoxylate transaminase/serine-glyoxylate transaminase/serine-pyruvate transaminase